MTNFDHILNWRLTPAGEHLHALLVIAGLSVEMRKPKTAQKRRAA